jgi:two-component system response regulator BaeR
MSNPVLIVEDEIKIAELLRDYCDDSGFQTELIHNGDDALSWFKHNTARLILLDLMLPGTDGLTLCREIRKHSDVPIIMITARVEEIDRLLGLELGADDYICKPFSPREVVARIKSILRRVENKTNNQTELKLDEASFKVSYQQAVTELTLVEFQLLKTLISQPGRIFSRDILMTQIYSDNRIVSDRTIDSHIKKLRKKLLEIGLQETAIYSVYGAGYKYE